MTRDRTVIRRKMKKMKNISVGTIISRMYTKCSSTRMNTAGRSSRTVWKSSMVHNNNSNNNNNKWKNN